MSKLDIISDTDRCLGVIEAVRHLVPQLVQLPAHVVLQCQRLLVMLSTATIDLAEYLTHSCSEWHTTQLLSAVDACSLAKALFFRLIR